MDTATAVSQDTLKLWGSVQEYQHEGLCRRFSEKHEISLGEAKSVFEETKRFLFVSMISDEPCSPSRIVDEMWHDFISHTMDYREFCDTYHDGFVDHTPSDVPEIDGYVRTKALAESIFGALDPFCWPEPSKASVIGKCTCSNKGCTCNGKESIRLRKK